MNEVNAAHALAIAAAIARAYANGSPSIAATNAVNLAVHLEGERT